MTKADLLLQLLKHAEPFGLHSFDLIRQIHSTRVAARINDLKKRGYHITSIREQVGSAWGCRYFLNSDQSKHTVTPKHIDYILVDPMKSEPRQMRWI